MPARAEQRPPAGPGLPGISGGGETLYCRRARCCSGAPPTACRGVKSSRSIYYFSLEGQGAACARPPVTLRCGGGATERRWHGQVKGSRVRRPHQQKHATQRGWIVVVYFILRPQDHGANRGAPLCCIFQMYGARRRPGTRHDGLPAFSLKRALGDGTGGACGARGAREAPRAQNGD
eukprot:gene17985-biopygen11432